MKKALLIILIVLSIPLKASAVCRGENPQVIDWEGQGFTIMSTTAYCVGHHTANGSAVHHDGCACSIDHIGDVAIIYTLDGNFLGYYECNDTGAEGGGVRAGRVVDVYRCNLTMCESYMKITGGKIYVKWIKGVG